jgi:2-haloacid dehalogenase
MANDLTIVFDLGGVLIDWNPRHLYRKMLTDETAIERFLEEVCSPAWNLAMDAGRPFAEGVADLARTHPEKRELIEAYHERWIEMVGGPIAETVALLEALDARGLPLYALSNWSAETFLLVRHVPAYAFLDRFRHIVVSGEIGMVKPDRAIYDHLLGIVGRPAASCLFIDDNAANIEAARALGFHTHRFVDAQGLRAALVEQGLLG